MGYEDICVVFLEMSSEYISNYDQPVFFLIIFMSAESSGT